MDKQNHKHFNLIKCEAYRNLVYDLVRHESPIAQWLKRPTGIWKIMGSTPVEDSENSFSEDFDLKALLCYLNENSFVYFCAQFS